MIEEIRNLRIKAKETYLQTLETIWLSDLDVAKKESKTRKEYNLYRDKDRLLERLEAMQESIFEDLGYYNKKYK